jgi:hypothetical protein
MPTTATLAEIELLLKRTASFSASPAPPPDSGGGLRIMVASI